MRAANEKCLNALLAHSIEPALFDDCKFKSEEEFDALKQHLIEAIEEIPYVDIDVYRDSNEYDDGLIQESH
jgi:hypothetical protein